MFLDQNIDEKMYFFEVAIKKSNPDWVHLPVSPEKSENPTSGNASRAFFLLFFTGYIYTHILQDTFTHTMTSHMGCCNHKNAQEGIGAT